MQSAPILVVEDNERDATLICHTLKVAGISNPVSIVDTVEAAIEYLSREAEECDRELGTLPKVVFIDLVLPGQSGHELLAWIRTRDKLRDLIRVVLTGSNDPEDLHRAHQLGAHCYLNKPLTVDQLTNPLINLRLLLAAGE